LYADDLAYIHDAGFSHHARGTADGVVGLLRANGVDGGLVVELGCGGGITAAHLTASGYDTLGVDQSAGLLRLARQRAPRARFTRGSFFDFTVPPCAAVLSMGECLGYRAGKRGGTGAMMRVIRRVHRALPRDGLFIFDLVTPKVAEAATYARSGPDWALNSQNTRDRTGAWLRREITTFRRHGHGYRRGSAPPHVQLYDAANLSRRLRDLGFAVRVRKSLGDYDLAPGRVLFIARKR
jgi:SAM-dependent methyltransferase